MAPSFVYVSVFTFLLGSGAPIEADDGIYPTYDSCMLEAESNARQLAREWAWNEERTGLPGFYKGVEVRCERRQAPKARKAGKGGRHGK